MCYERRIHWRWLINMERERAMYAKQSTLLAFILLKALFQSFSFLQKKARIKKDGISMSARLHKANMNHGIYFFSKLLSFFLFFFSVLFLCFLPSYIFSFPKTRKKISTKIPKKSLVNSQQWVYHNTSQSKAIFGTYYQIIKIKITPSSYTVDKYSPQIYLLHSMHLLKISLLMIISAYSSMHIHPWVWKGISILF